METRCFWPPESSVGSASAKSVMATAARASFTRSTIWGWGMPRFSGPKATSSATMLVTIWLSGF